jgi:hypothetical protein
MLRLLINGRQQPPGPATYIVGGILLLLVLALLVFVVLPTLAVVAIVGSVAGALYVGARALGLVGRRRGARIGDDEAEYRVESSKPLDPDDRTLLP